MGSRIDSRIRSIVKSVTWRILALTITILVSFVIVGNWTVSISIGIVANLTKAFFYYIHERFWERIGWGRESKQNRLKPAKIKNLRNDN